MTVESSVRGILVLLHSSTRGDIRSNGKSEYLLAYFSTCTTHHKEVFSTKQCMLDHLCYD